MGPILNNHSEITKPFDVTPGIISSSGIKKAGVVYFLEDLYTYPPKIKIQWKQLDPILATGKNNCDEYPAKLKSKPKLNILNSLNDYVNTVTSSDFYTKKTNTIRQALKTVPVYVIVNGNNELVLATTRSGRFQFNSDFSTSLLNEQNVEVTQRGLTRRPASRKLVEKTLSSQTKKFGFMFFDQNEAELYLDSIMEQSEESTHTKRSRGLNKVGLSIHCIGLDSAYDLVMRRSNVDFRFIPSLTEVTALLKSSNQDTVLASDFKDLVSNDNQQSVKGVPIYLVQVLNTSKSHTITSWFNAAVRLIGVSSVFNDPKELELNSYTDHVTHLNFESTINSLEQSELSTDTDNKFQQSNLNGITNYILFNKEQAIEFAQKFNRRVVIGNIGANSQLGDLNPTTIYTYNLEDFLESWEESILVKPSSNKTIFALTKDQPVYFIPSKRSAKTLEQHYSKPKNSLNKSVKLWARARLNKLFWFQHNYLGILLRGFKV